MLARSVRWCDLVLRLLTERSWHVFRRPQTQSLAMKVIMGQGPLDVIDWAEGRTG